MDLSKIDTIVLSSGGIKGMYFLGFLKALFEHIDRNNIKHYISCSVGVIFSFVLIIGYTLDEIENILLNYDLNKLVPKINLDNLLLDLGLTDGEAFIEFFEDLFEYKSINKNITFKELYDITKIKFTITVTNFSKQSVEYWNFENTPDLTILQGLLASSRVPIYFKPLKVNNDYYIDGCIINGYPIDIIPIENVNNVIGACITNSNKIDEIKNLFISNDKYDKIIEYISLIISLFFYNKLQVLNKKYINRTVQFIDLYGDCMNLTIDNSSKQFLINSSYLLTHIHIIKHFNIK